MRHTVTPGVYVLQCRKPLDSTGDSRCRLPAGYSTGHSGYGHCRYHASSNEDRIWRMAITQGRQLEVTPWEALLTAVRLAAGAVERTESMLSVIESRSGDDITSALRYWRDQSQRERRELSRAARDAIAAGVAEQIVRQSQVEGQLVATALVQALNAVPGMTQEQRVAALASAHDYLTGVSSTVSTQITDSALPEIEQ